MSDEYRCERCAKRFHTERLRRLHVGYEHEDGDLSEAERAAFEDAYRAETAEIRRFRLKVVGTLVILYFGLLFTYVLVT